MLGVSDRNLRRWHVWTANGLCLVYFGVMSLLTAMALPGFAFYKCPLGLCIGGYEPNTARETIAALGEDGRAFISDTLMPMDWVLPILIVIALCLTYLWFSRPEPDGRVPLSPIMRYCLLTVPVLYCIADFAENAAIVRMVREFPSIGDRLAHRASELTAAKSQLITAALFLAGGLCLTDFVQRRRDRKNYTKPG